MTTNYIAPGYFPGRDERERDDRIPAGWIVPAIRRSTPAVDEWIDEQLREQWDREQSDPGWETT